jgi:hypothetical protein
MTLATAVELGRFERALLQAARTEVAPRDALRKSASALGVSLPAIGLAAFEMTFVGSAAQATGAPAALATTGAASAGLATATPAGTAALATGSAGAAGTGVASQPIATATLVLLAKHVGAGVLAGALLAGGAHEASKAFDAPTRHRVPTPVLAQSQGAKSAPTRRALAVGDAPSSETELRSSAEVASSSEPAALGPAVRPPLVPAGGPGLASRGAKAAGTDDAVAEQMDTDAPDGNVAAFPPQPSAQADPETKLEAMPEPVGLELERLLLGRAERALARGRPLVALRHLGLYSAKCAGGQLDAEANMLRVEALLRAGQRDKALSVARREIERNSTRATVERVREMFQAQGEPADPPAGADAPTRASEKE